MSRRTSQQSEPRKLLEAAAENEATDWVKIYGKRAYREARSKLAYLDLATTVKLAMPMLHVVRRMSEPMSFMSELMAFDTSAMMLTEEEHGTGAIGLHVAEEDHDTGATRLTEDLSRPTERWRSKFTCSNTRRRTRVVKEEGDS